VFWLIGVVEALGRFAVRYGLQNCAIWASGVWQPCARPYNGVLRRSVAGFGAAT